MVPYIKNTLLIFLISGMAISSQVLIKKGLNRIGGFDFNAIAKSVYALLTNAYVLIAIVMITALSILYCSVLSRMSLSALYPIIIGANFVILVIMSVVFLNESFQPLKILGVLLILVGIVILSISAGKSGISMR